MAKTQFETARELGESREAIQAIAEAGNQPDCTLAAAILALIDLVLPTGRG